MTDAVLAEGLVKRFKSVTALDGLDLRVPQGSVLGVLGPNGAGKTTAVRILTTLLRPDEGRAEVAGVDVLAHPARARARIGVSGQYAAVDEYLTGFENLDMIGRLYHLGRRRSRERARTLLEQFRLEEAGDRMARTYSGGMRRRLDLAGALVADPPVLFLDEPTTGLDPRSRTDMWEVIKQLVAGGTSLLLTTQYLEEADLLADNIVVIDHGRVIAEGTADQLKAQVGGERLEITVSDAARVDDAVRLLQPLAVGQVSVEAHQRSLLVPVTGGATVLADALRRLDGEGVQVDDVGLRRPTLDDVFLTLTGHVAEEHPDETGDGSRDSGPDERRSDHRADQGSESETVR
jgi:ABC-2 type transport system ATP-binding protein